MWWTICLAINVSSTVCNRSLVTTALMELLSQNELWHFNYQIVFILVLIILNIYTWVDNGHSFLLNTLSPLIISMVLLSQFYLYHPFPFLPLSSSFFHINLSPYFSPQVLFSHFFLPKLTVSPTLSYSYHLYFSQIFIFSRVSPRTTCFLLDRFTLTSH